VPLERADGPVTGARSGLEAVVGSTTAVLVDSSITVVVFSVAEQLVALLMKFADLFVVVAFGA
jgi:hypothetical protein